MFNMIKLFNLEPHVDFEEKLGDYIYVLYIRFSNYPRVNQSKFAVKRDNRLKHAKRGLHKPRDSFKFGF